MSSVEIDQTLRHMHKVQKLREKIAEEDRLLTVLSPFKHSLEALLANLETKRQQAEDAARENNVASAAIPANCHAPAEAGDAGPAATVLPGLAWIHGWQTGEGRKSADTGTKEWPNGHRETVQKKKKT